MKAFVAALALVLAAGACSSDDGATPPSTSSTAAIATQPQGPPLTPGADATLVGRVVLSDGTPGAGLDVVAQGERDNNFFLPAPLPAQPTPIPDVHARTGADGRFEMVIPATTEEETDRGRTVTITDQLRPGAGAPARIVIQAGLVESVTTLPDLLLPTEVPRVSVRGDRIRASISHGGIPGDEIAYARVNARIDGDTAAAGTWSVRETPTHIDLDRRLMEAGATIAWEAAGQLSKGRPDPITVRGPGIAVDGPGRPPSLGTLCTTQAQTPIVSCSLTDGILQPLTDGVDEAQLSALCEDCAAAWAGHVGGIIDLGRPVIPTFALVIADEHPHVDGSLDGEHWFALSDRGHTNMQAFALRAEPTRFLRIGSDLTTPEISEASIWWEETPGT